MSILLAKQSQDFSGAIVIAPGGKRKKKLAAAVVS
jgi:hypothetical protein